MNGETNRNMNRSIDEQINNQRVTNFEIRQIVQMLNSRILERMKYEQINRYFNKNDYKDKYQMNRCQAVLR